MSRPDPHAVFRNRLLLHDAGLLTEEEEAAQEAHAQACAECREIRDAHAAEEGAGERAGGHIPSAILARWDRAAPSFRGLEREVLARHLAFCESCRRDLETVGHDPALLVGADPSPGTPEDTTDTTRIYRIDSRARRRFWLQGALAGAALAAAAAIVFRPSPPAMETGALPWVVPAATRGSAPETAIGPGTRRILLAVPTPSAPSEGEAQLTVTGPSDAVVLDTGISSDRLRSPTLMVVLSNPHGLEPGLYTVNLLPEGAPEPQVLSFRLVATGP
jgi:hypothetical protein